MITCAWCGEECDAFCWAERSSKVVFSSPDSNPLPIVWATSVKRLFFCDFKCRINYFREP